MEKVIQVSSVDQENDRECGVAIMKMLLSRIHRPEVVDGIVDLVLYTNKKIQTSQSSPIDTVHATIGITPDQLAEAIEQAGISIAARGYKAPFPLVMECIDAQQPIVAYLQDGPQGAFGHFVLIIGYGRDENAGGREYLVFHDPQHGPSKRVYYDNFPSEYIEGGAWDWYESFVIAN